MIPLLARKGHYIIFVQIVLPQPGKIQRDSGQCLVSGVQLGSQQNTAVFSRYAQHNYNLLIFTMFEIIAHPARTLLNKNRKWDIYTCST